MLDWVKDKSQQNYYANKYKILICCTTYNYIVFLKTTNKQLNQRFIIILILLLFLKTIAVRYDYDCPLQRNLHVVFLYESISQIVKLHH